MSLKNRQIDGQSGVSVGLTDDHICFETGAARITDSGVLIIVEQDEEVYVDSWQIIAAFGVGQWVWVEPNDAGSAEN